MRRIAIACRIRFDYDRSMKEGPNIAIIAALVGDPARANMLNALLGGKALTASELAAEAGVTLQTTSSHLSKLQQARLIEQEQQGRHRYFRLAGSDVADVLEGLGTLAARAGHLRVRPGPKDPAMRRARMCYDHLAGEFGVRMFDSLVNRKLLTIETDSIEITPRGAKFVAEFGVDLESVQTSRRPLCKKCLDWSERRSHLAGSLGAALLDRVFDLKWARREADGRVVRFTPAGEQKFVATFVALSGRYGPRDSGACGARMTNLPESRQRLERVLLLRWRRRRALGGLSLLLLLRRRCARRRRGFGAGDGCFRAFAVGQPHVVDRMLDAGQPRARREHPARKNPLHLALQRDLVDLDEGVGVGGFRGGARVAGLRLHPQRAELHGLGHVHVELDDAAGDLVESGEHRLLVDDLLRRRRGDDLVAGLHGGGAAVAPFCCGR